MKCQVKQQQTIHLAIKFIHKQQQIAVSNKKKIIQ